MAQTCVNASYIRAGLLYAQSLRLGTLMAEDRAETPPVLVKVLCVLVIVASIAFLIFLAPTIDHESSQEQRATPKNGQEPGEYRAS